MISTIILAASLLVAGVNAQVGQWGQCGIGWTGGTTCVSGTVCTELNPYYYQCLTQSSTSTIHTTTTTTTTRITTTSTTSHTTTGPTTIIDCSPRLPPCNGPTTTMASTHSTTTTSTAGIQTGSCGAIPRLAGVNLAGFDFTVYTNGSFTGPPSPPPVSQITHFAAEGVNLYRIPFGWQLATPTLGGTVSSSWLSQYDAVVNAALNTGAWVIIDLHNYARWNGGIINQGGPTTAQFASFWSQLATHYASQCKVIFGLMNEPHDLPSIAPWVAAVQAAVNAIRAAGATSQYILMPGSSYSSAATLPTEAGPQLLTVTDPVGGVTKLIFDVHKYLDSDNSGTHADCVTNNAAVFTTLTTWLSQNGRQAILSETGGGSTSSCETDLNQELAQIKSEYPTMIGFAVWSAGSFATSYILSVVPNPNGSDQPIWTDAVVPNIH